MKKFIGEKRYKYLLALDDVRAFIRRQPVFKYSLLILIAFLLSLVINRNVSFMALFDGEGVFTIDEVIAQEESGLPQSTEPFVVQAENFVVNDSETDVTIEKSNDLGGGVSIGGLDDEETLVYSFTVPRISTYDVSIRVARDRMGGSEYAYFRVEIDDKNISGKLSLADTGGWDKWITLSVGKVNLNAGSHKLVVKMIDNDGTSDLMNIGWFGFVPEGKRSINPEKVYSYSPDPTIDSNDTNSESSTTLSTSKIAKSFFVEAEDYGTKGQNKSYHDVTPGNDGYQYRDDDVDIEYSNDVNGGYNVGWIDNDEWLKYDISIASESNYSILARVARVNHDGVDQTYFQLYIDGRRVGSRVGVSGTGGWSNWVTLNTGQINIKPGDHTFEFKIEDNSTNWGLMNVNWFKFVPDTQELVLPEPYNPSSYSPPSESESEPDPTTPPSESEPDPTTPPPSPNPAPDGVRGPRQTGCNGVDIYSGNDIQSKSDDYPAETVFCLKPGIYYQQEVDPKDGQEFIGEYGAVLDGQFSTTFAFAGYSNDVTIENLEIRNYDTPQQMGAINRLSPGDWYRNPIPGPGGWTVKNNNIHHNSGGGVVLSRDNIIVENNIISDNGQIGIKTLFGKNHLVQNNEIARNKTDPTVDWGWEGGGSKFWETENLTLNGNYVHDNNGAGLWSDYRNRNTVYSNNTIEDNTHPGIFHEISYNATIFGNTIRRNGHGDSSDGWVWGAGILIANGGPALVYDNLLEDNFNAITFNDRARGYGPVAGTIYGNTVINSGITGVAAASGGDILYEEFDFYDNSYQGSNSWTWDNREMSYSEWLDYFPND